MGLRLDVRWRIAISLCAITTINYIDRQALTVAAPLLKDEFGITNTQYGDIVAAFLLTYALGQLLSGPLIDRLGTKRAFSIAAVAWSIAGMLHALGRGFFSFLSLRMLLGITEAANFPVATKAIAEWFPKSERSLAVGIMTMGPGLGAVLAPPFIAFLILSFGWQWAFIIPGAIGLVWAWYWQRSFYAVEEHPALTDDERQMILREREQPADEPDNRPWYWSLRYRAVWGLMLARFVSDGAFYFFVFFLPLYLSEARGFDLKAIGLFAWIPFLAADMGSLFGGWAGQRMIKSGMSLHTSRNIIIWCGALLVPVAMPAASTESPMMALALISVALFAIQVKASAVFTLPADLFPSRDVGTIWGLFGAIGSLGAFAFTPFVGRITDQWGWEPVFIIVAGMHIVSAVIINLTIPRIQRLELAPAS